MDKAIAFYQKWYRDKFPSAPAPELPKSETAKSKYTFNQILDLVEHDSHGAAARGRIAHMEPRAPSSTAFTRPLSRAALQLAKIS